MGKATDALTVRRSALLILRAKGINKAVRNLGMCHSYCGGGIEIMFRTPFQRIARPSGRWVIEAAIQGLKIQPQLPYGLDIWADGDGKVFNFEWDDREQCRVVTFKKGPWQEQLENICAREVLDKVPDVCAAQAGV